MNEHEAIERFFDSLDAVDSDGHYDRASGIVDMQAGDIVVALLRAGWTLPGKAPAREGKPIEVHGPSYGEPRIGMFRPPDEERET